MENTPERVCNDEGGVWDEREKDEIPQCQLGCCLIGDQAAFVTQTRCKRLSSLYGLETNYRTDINDEFSCISSATSDVKGACVFEEEFQKTCELTTKRECQERMSGSATTGEGYGTNIEFHEGYLCSDGSLGTNCGSSEKTTCVEGRDEVYFLDTCGNLANVYDATKVNDTNYWSEISEPSCGDGSGSAGSATCGDCDYLSGSTCKSYKRGEDRVKPNYGDNVCRNLGCTYEGEDYKHGETWCADSKGVDKSLPGSRHFRLVCYNSEVLIEPCADFRQEVCIQDEISIKGEDFKTAACRVNLWQDCVIQDNKKDCENTDKRDCEWIGGTDKCTPKYAPGFNFWGASEDSKGNEDTSEAESVCSIANDQCVITYEKKYEKKIEGVRKIKSGQECLKGGSWEKEKEKLCVSLGDCGEKKNYNNNKGYLTWEDMFSGESY